VAIEFGPYTKREPVDLMTVGFGVGELR